MQVVIEGVSPNEPTIVNERGGKQSRTLYAFDALDAKAMFAMCKVLYEGRRKYGFDGNWRQIPPKDHANHLLIHIFAWLAGDTSDEHLSHAMCRAMFLYATANESEDII